jgi:hypothetical protein
MMKRLTRFIVITKSTLIVALLFLVAGSFQSCEKKTDFMVSSVVPAARGSVKVKQDKNKNYAIQIHVTDLAEVQRLDSLKLSYVAWIETAEDKYENIGQLISTASGFAKQYKASLSTVTSFQPLKVFITAEDDINVQIPDRKVVLTTDRL